jgi:hypothetical protein
MNLAPAEIAMRALNPTCQRVHLASIPSNTPGHTEIKVSEVTNSQIPTIPFGSARVFLIVSAPDIFQLVSRLDFEPFYVPPIKAGTSRSHEVSSHFL